MEENSQIGVFETTEVIVSQFSETTKGLTCLSNYDLAKLNLEALNAKHEARATELCLINKLSPIESKEIISIRAELRTPRYLLQKIVKDNKSAFEAYKKAYTTKLEELIEINESLEDKVNSKIKQQEQFVKEGKEEAQRIEVLRVQTIKDKIDEIEKSCYDIINQTSFDEVDFSKTKLVAFSEIDFDFEEYDILFEGIKSRVESAFESKISSLTILENQRLDNIRLEEENKEAKRVSDLQASRLTEIMPYVAFGEPIDLSRLHELEEDVFDGLLHTKESLFNLEVMRKDKEKELLDAENLAKETKARQEKDQIFEVRKKRLAEIGLNLIDYWFKDDSGEILVNQDVIYSKEALLFEEYLEGVKEYIKSIPVLKFIKSELGEPLEEVQKEIDLKLSKGKNQTGWNFVNLEQLKQANKERVRRLSKDKLYFSTKINKIPLLSKEFSNEESLLFVTKANERIQSLKNELLTELDHKF